MNNKGQSLIIFVLVLPILILFILFFVDLAMVSYQKNKIDGVIHDNLVNVLNDEIKDKERIKDIFKENDINIINITISNEIITIDVYQEIKSIFGNLAKLKFYTIKDNFVGNYITKRIDKVG